LNMPVNLVNPGRFHPGPAAAAEQQLPAGLRWNLLAVLRTCTGQTGLRVWPVERS
jgi:hypothetical protein